MNAVRVSENVDSVYAYAASNTRTDGDCDPISADNCAQLYIFDVTDDNDIEIVTHLKLSTLSVDEPVWGASLYFKNNYVYLGLNKNNAREFYLIDVNHPENMGAPSYLVTPVGNGFEVGRQVNDVTARRGLAYVAGATAEDLRILDITDPLIDPLPEVGSFNGPSTGGGKSVSLVADNLYLAKTHSIDGEEFFTLDISDPTNPTVLDSVEIGESINKVIVRDYLTFLLTNSKLIIVDADTGAEIENKNLPNDGGDEKPSMDCEGDRIYITTNTNSQGYIHIVRPNEDEE